jgi:hypothetical protein
LNGFETPSWLIFLLSLPSGDFFLEKSAARRLGVRLETEKLQSLNSENILSNA